MNFIKNHWLLILVGVVLFAWWDFTRSFGNKPSIILSFLNLFNGKGGAIVKPGDGAWVSVQGGKETMLPNYSGL